MGKWRCQSEEREHQGWVSPSDGGPEALVHPVDRVAFELGFEKGEWRSGRGRVSQTGEKTGVKVWVQGSVTVRRVW